MKTKLRSIRFSEREEAQISEFLKKNPVIDFSTLARAAILSFIKEPNFKFTPVDQVVTKGQKGEANVRL